MTKINDLEKRTLTLKRTFKAPIQLVWQAWTEAKHVAQWWGPKGMEVEVLEHDFRIGGVWKYGMVMPNGSTFISEGKYLEIVEQEKIISSADFKPMTTGVKIQAYFEAEGDMTNFTFSVVHDTEEYCKQQEKMGCMNGWGSVFDRLNSFVVA